MMRSTLALAVALLAWVHGRVHADDAVYVHIVRPGETLASIAQTYYGDPKRENVLVAENGLTDQGGSAIVEGLHLVVPTVRYHRVQEGDSWRALAERYYGDEKRAPVLMKANEQKPGGNPDEGAELLIPYPLRHVVRPGDSLASLAEQYYGDRIELRLIRAFNKIKGRMTRGQILLIPLFDLVLSEAGAARIGRATGQNPERGDVRALQAAIDGRIPELRAHVERGRYAEAVALGNQLLGTGKLTGNQELSIHRELGTAYVALGRPDMGADSFARALARQPDLELDSMRTSPLVLAAFEQAKKTRDAKKRP